VLGRKTDVLAGEAGFAFSHGERQLCFPQDVHEVTVVDDDVDRIDEANGWILSLADFEPDGIHDRIIAVRKERTR
jgi:hypothetical protein